MRDSAQLRVGSAGMVRVLQEIFGWEADSETRLVARVKQFKKNGIPLPERRGRGFNVSYGPREAARLAVGFAMLDSGMATHAACEALKLGSADLEEALDLAVRGKGRATIAVPGSELRIYRSREAVLTEGSRIMRDHAELLSAHSEPNGFRSYANILVDVSALVDAFTLAFANEVGVDRNSVVLALRESD
ncbi:hypothetical protein E3U23_07525 [Erythrobacter litoralis]|uniref:hypothetical protein n=1 Tax=Erythrobacter litoralis TaxID=39960 RepID=UPI002435DB5C|nr:hypothetical protein [Erythrobacter litoralis]MDG6079040.1 hypothetical protein [Erythrobacter litoralis]